LSRKFQTLGAIFLTIGLAGCSASGPARQVQPTSQKPAIAAHVVNPKTWIITGYTSKTADGYSLLRVNLLTGSFEKVGAYDPTVSAGYHLGDSAWRLSGDNRYFAIAATKLTVSVAPLSGGTGNVFDISDWSKFSVDDAVVTAFFKPDEPHTLQVAVKTGDDTATVLAYDVAAPKKAPRQSQEIPLLTGSLPDVNNLDGSYVTATHNTNPVPLPVTQQEIDAEIVAGGMINDGSGREALDAAHARLMVEKQHKQDAANGTLTPLVYAYGTRLGDSGSSEDHGQIRTVDGTEWKFAITDGHMLTFTRTAAKPQWVKFGPTIKDFPLTQLEWLKPAI
jgi:hypothetical protein